MAIYKATILDNNGRVIERMQSTSAERTRAAMYAALEFYAQTGRAARGQFKRARV